MVEIQIKEKFYRGHKLEQLKDLDIREFAKYLPSRSRRSVLRNFDVVEKFIKSCEEKVKRNKSIRTHLRDMIIVPKMVGMLIEVHNGKKFDPIEVKIEMIGHRLGEFSATRVRPVHTSVGIGATKGSKTQKK